MKRIIYSIPEAMVVFGAFIILGMLGRIQNQTHVGVGLQARDVYITVTGFLIAGAGVILRRFRRAIEAQKGKGRTT